MAHLHHTPAAQAASRPIAPSAYDLAGHDGYWPQNALQAFTLRMASHGLCVSTSMMLGDRRYALEQLGHAHAMADDELRGLAVELFRHFERKQSGLPLLS
jgi:dienelactone hydrolase